MATGIKTERLLLKRQLLFGRPFVDCGVARLLALGAPRLGRHQPKQAGLSARAIALLLLRLIDGDIECRQHGGAILVGMQVIESARFYQRLQHLLVGTLQVDAPTEVEDRAKRTGLARLENAERRAL